jgi:hypothetical protein
MVIDLPSIKGRVLKIRPLIAILDFGFAILD